VRGNLDLKFFLICTEIFNGNVQFHLV
jgi:hypothetical protein